MTKQTVWRVFLTVLIAGIFLVQYQQVRLLERIANQMAVTTTQTAASEGVLVHSFKSNGVVYYVVTTRYEQDPLETKVHWQRRHLDEIEAAWQERTPD